VKDLRAAAPEGLFVGEPEQAEIAKHCDRAHEGSGSERDVIMRKTISLVILTNSGSAARQFRASRATLRAVVVLSVILLGMSGFLIYDYIRLKSGEHYVEQRDQELSGTLASQRDEIQIQRQQISDFSNEINTLKEKLLALNEFEKKIRVMADLDKRPDSGNLFGIGGPIPRTLDPKMALGEQRNSLVREMNSQVDQLTLAAVTQEDHFKALVTHIEKQKGLLASTPTIRPIDPDTEHLVTSRFEYRLSPFTNVREFHKGYDISAREGTPIYATAAGTVTFAGDKGLLGKTIVIDHGHGLTTTYGHCSRILKLQGEKVRRWDPIALVGNTGRSTGPHLHYEVALHGVPVNPEKYFLN
jgi:murein DD-endopeptidase MepM/ murein hydrolase activator NlpD